MCDDRLQELISAYFDGEVSAEERAQVEQRLANSVECRQFYDQLARQRLLVRSIPRHTLQVDLSHRVLERIERSRPAIIPDANRIGDRLEVELSTPAVGLPARRSRWQSWRSVAMTVGTVSAMLMLGFYLARPDRSGLKNGSPSAPSQSPVVAGDAKIPKTEGQDWSASDMQVAVAEFQKLVRLIMVYDIRVTPRAQKAQVVEAWMHKAGIPLVQQIAVDTRLEKKILESRFIGQAKGDAAGNTKGDRDKDKVQVLFVRGTGKQIDGFYRSYREFVQDRGQKDSGVEIKLDLVVSPEELELFLRLNQATGLGLAQMKADPALLRSAAAFPIRFREPLQSASIGRPVTSAGTATGSDHHTRNVRPVAPKSNGDGEMFLALATPQFAFAPGMVAGQAGAPAPEGGAGWDQPSQALFIIRTLNDAPQ